jgi:uncharacterized protein
MKLQPDRFDTLSVNAHGPGWVAVNGQKWSESVVVSSQGELFGWNCAGFDQLTAAHFEQLLAGQPELVIFGSGTRLRFAPPAMLRSLIEKGVGVECMDTLAACRTYNILAGEGRKVVAALLIEAA